MTEIIAIIKLIGENWPQAIGLATAAIIAYRLSGIVTSQHQTNTRVRKLIKLHATRHPADGAYLYDDSVE